MFRVRSRRRTNEEKKEESDTRMTTTEVTRSSVRLHRHHRRAQRAIKDRGQRWRRDAFCAHTNRPDHKEWEEGP